MKHEIYGSANYQDFMNDSSNHAHDGANGHEGVPEMLQRKAKENYGPSPILKVLPEICAAHIAKKLLGGDICL